MAPVAGIANDVSLETTPHIDTNMQVHKLGLKQYGTLQWPIILTILRSVPAIHDDQYAKGDGVTRISPVSKDAFANLLILHA